MPAPANFSVASLKQILQHQLSVEENSTIALAYSGGLDSHVLLHALSVLASSYPFTLTAIHIDHSLHVKSHHWADHCQNVCDALPVPLRIKTLSISVNNGESIEAVAREARYAALAENLPANGLCLTAQHKNDQSETLLLQLLRGAGVHGLAAMPASKTFYNGRLLRPLLNFSRDDLLQYANHHKLVWIEDPSNLDSRFDRNFLRNEALPVLRERWPGLDKSLSRSARHAASAAAMLDEIARSDLLNCKAVSNQQYPSAISCLNADLLTKLSTTHRLNALRYWVRMHGLVVPGEERLQSLNRLFAESTGRGCVDWSEGILRLDQNLLWLCDKSDEDQPDQMIVDWPLPKSLQIRMWKLNAVKVRGEGLAVSALNGSTLRVGFRQGGEQCCMPGKHGKKSLKALYQDLSVPVWIRDSIPLIFLNEELVAVGSIWSNPHHLPNPDEDGYVFSVHLGEHLNTVGARHGVKLSS